MKTPRPIPKALRADYQFRRARAAARYGKKSDEYKKLFVKNFLAINKAREEAAKAFRSPLQKAMDLFKKENKE